jgi:hypothetical protein
VDGNAAAAGAGQAAAHKPRRHGGNGRPHNGGGPSDKRLRQNSAPRVVDGNVAEPAPRADVARFDDDV